MHRTFIRLSAILGFYAVATGAMATHLLQGRLSAHALDVFDTGSRYAMYHALGLALVGVLVQRGSVKQLTAAGWCFAIGSLLFTGSLHAFALSGQKGFGAVAPLGGLTLMSGWILLFVAASPKTPEMVSG